MKAELINTKEKNATRPLGRFKSLEEASNYKVNILNNIFKDIDREKFTKLGK